MLLKIKIIKANIFFEDVKSNIVLLLLTPMDTKQTENG
jgi:hypothetical protein